MGSQRKCKETIVDVIEGKHTDAHIIFNTCEEGFLIKITESKTDKLHYIHQTKDDEIKIYKNYQSVITKAKEIVNK